MQESEIVYYLVLLSDTHLDTYAFIIYHLTEVAKMTHQHVIDVWGTITAIAHVLNPRGSSNPLNPIC